MERRPLGNTGLLVSPLCLGTRNFGRTTRKRIARRILGQALEAGINFIDTAPRYQLGASEKMLGKALAKDPRRDDVIVATKVFVPPGTENVGTFIQRCCEGSLKRLRTDRIDLYQLHRPVPHVRQEEVLRAFAGLVAAGKVRYLGCSTHPAAMVEEAHAICQREGWPAYVSEQPPYNLLERYLETELLPVCQRHSMAMLAWSPLAGGILADRYAAGQPYPRDSRAAKTDHFGQKVTAEALRVAGELKAVARDRGQSLGQLALLWVRDRPGITSTLVGPRTPEHLAAALAVTDQPLTSEDLARIDAIVPPGTTTVDFHTPERAAGQAAAQS